LFVIQQSELRSKAFHFHIRWLENAAAVFKEKFSKREKAFVVLVEQH